MVRFLTLFDLLFDPYAIYGRFLTLLTSFSTSKNAKTVLLTFNKYNIDNNKKLGKMFNTSLTLELKVNVRKL